MDEYAIRRLFGQRTDYYKNRNVRHSFYFGHFVMRGLYQNRKCNRVLTESEVQYIHVAMALGDVR